MDKMKNNLNNIYSLMLKSYGPRGWWPVTPVGGCRNEKPTSPIYCTGPKNEKQKIEIIIGAILTQNTAWKNVEKAIINLNAHGLIDIRKINKIPKQTLAGLIRSSGYFNQKAIKLKTMAGYLTCNPMTKLQEMNLDSLRIELLKLHGIGPETADSILLYAFNRPIFVVDAYTRRIFSRIGIIKEDAGYDEIQELFMRNLIGDANMFGEYHALIVEHAKRYCKIRPDCKDCILFHMCSLPKKGLSNK